MPGAPLLTRLTSRLDIPADSDVADVVFRDELTQRDYEFRIPLHIVPALISVLADALRDRPDLFPDTSTRLRRPH